MVLKIKIYTKTVCGNNKIYCWAWIYARSHKCVNKTHVFCLFKILKSNAWNNRHSARFRRTSSMYVIFFFFGKQWRIKTYETLTYFLFVFIVSASVCQTSYWPYKYENCTKNGSMKFVNIMKRFAMQIVFERLFIVYLHYIKSKKKKKTMEA